MAKEQAEKIRIMERRISESEKGILCLGDLKTQLASILRKVATLDTISKDLTEVKAALEFSNNQTEIMREELKKGLGEVKDCKEDLLKLTAENRKLKSELDLVLKISESNSFKLRGKNVIVRNVPCLPQENLYSFPMRFANALNFKLDDKEVSKVTRFKGNEKRESGPLLIEFRESRIRDCFLAATKNKIVTADELGIGKEKGRLFFSEDLTPAVSLLFAKAREFKRNANWKFAWCKYGKVFVKKSEKTTAIWIQDVSNFDCITW